MSQENVEIVRRWLEAISGGSEDFDRALALVHRDIVFVPPGDRRRTGVPRPCDVGWSQTRFRSTQPRDQGNPAG
ncbi:MAG TPA: nuclear transport factor 2 family protein, partial [Solirubrobacterales bacterium]|nr:nuclear transport factor 2 family protein [Solirubrobacterales bacterium]